MTTTLQRSNSHLSYGLLAIGCLLLTPVTLAAEDSQTDLDRKFEELLNGASLVGQFNIMGDSGESAPQPDSYTVSKISKLENGRWLFTASMSFGDNTIAIPMPFDVEWAGDTPMITLTEQTIEGLGTFSARVLIYDGLYAGTWKHGTFGGHMWGKIEKAAPAGD